MLTLEIAGFLIVLLFALQVALLWLFKTTFSP